MTTIAERLTRLSRRFANPPRMGGTAPNDGWQLRLDALEARTEHLEAELEGLQDAVYRRAILEDENIAELRMRTEPDQMARDLSRNARERGL